MANQFYIEKHNTIDQKFPLMWEIIKFYKRAGKVTVQGKGGSTDKETLKLADFQARFAPAK